ncbi:MAG: hypothetical protein KJZ65_14435 [Phycisphaerales bacterium]|nr:hypothetical protein [Phycisphaerales bacterium]
MCSLGVESTYEVEAWGRVTGDEWMYGVSAIAQFGIDVIQTGYAGMVSSVSTAYHWGGGIVLDNGGTPIGPDLVGVRGGQLANLFGFLNPDIDLSNPILLFTFEVTLNGEEGVSTYTPTNPAPQGGLSFYPDSTQGQSIVAPNDAGTTLTLFGATTSVLPAPGAAVLLGVSLVFGRRRRGRA